MEMLQKVVSLVETLNSEEKKVARQFMQAFEKARTAEDLRTIQLFDLLCKTELEKITLTEEQVKNLLYEGNIGNKTFYRLLARLQEKITESLILDVNILRAEAYSEQYKAKHSIRKKTIQASILLGRGKHLLALDLYDKIIEKCKQFEIYDELIETLYLKQQTVGIRSGKETYETLSRDINFYEHCRKGVLVARDGYHRIVINKAFKANETDHFTVLSDMIHTLQNYYVETNSQTIAYYLHYLLMEYYQQEKAYRMAAEIGNRLVAIIKGSKALYMERSLATAYINVADNYLYTYNFTESLNACRDAKELLPGSSYNYSVAREIEFYAAFYSGDLHEALFIIDGLLNEEPLQSELIQTKWYYLKACVLFVAKQYKDVDKLLELTKPIEADKEGWNINVRILSIMNDIEQGHDRLADSKIDRMRKHFKNHSAFISPRNHLIRTLLYDLANESNNFNDLYLKKLEVFEKLSSLDSLEGWQMKSPELVIFHKWFIAKAENRDYSVSLVKEVDKRVSA